MCGESPKLVMRRSWGNDVVNFILAFFEQVLWKDCVRGVSLDRVDLSQEGIVHRYLPDFLLEAE